MISIGIPKLTEFETKFANAQGITAEATRIGLERSALLLEGIMRREAPHKTGMLIASIKYRFINSHTVEIAPHKPYAIFVEKGTKAHVILPRNAKALFWPGALHPVKKVNHPGTKANPFVQRTASQAHPYIVQAFTDANKMIIRGLKV